MCELSVPEKNRLTLLSRGQTVFYGETKYCLYGVQLFEEDGKAVSRDGQGAGWDNMAMNLERVGETLYYVAFSVLFVYHNVVRDLYVQHTR